MNIWTRGVAGAAACAVLLLTGCETSDVAVKPQDAKPQDGAAQDPAPQDGMPDGMPGGAGGTDLALVVGEWKEAVSGDTPWTIRISGDGTFWTSDGSDTCEGTVRAVPSEADKTWRHFLADADCGWAGRQLAPLRLGEEDGEEKLILTNDSGEGSRETYRRVR
ncbi:hypothetical protein ACFQ8C_06090 [Streptomyces sp. NPDC056503]|uniref:hypothetical protein n=1 Tax=Streptomyces sp. NPDC056503 TaxID=3345842 RepID=UPI0036BE7C1B